jgi:predicted DNA-binding ArsR family transcriptional regulator
MSESSARVKEIVEKVKALSPNEQKLFREWLDAWIRLTEIEEKIKQAQRGE